MDRKTIERILEDYVLFDIITQQKTFSRCNKENIHFINDKVVKISQKDQPDYFTDIFSILLIGGRQKL